MKILIIEDEKMIAQSLSKGLQQEKYTVQMSFDGMDGYLEAATGEYDLIVLDLMLPSLDGISVCQRLRKEGVTTPILMLTAKSQTEDKVTGLNAGADDYLPKPFSFDELLARIKALLRRPPTLKNEVLTVGDLTLDRSNYEVKVNKKEVILTSKEYSILEYLLINKNKILSKEQIINSIWSSDAEVLPNTVEVNIRNLRKKINPNFIETMRGFGYRISDKNV